MLKHSAASEHTQKTPVIGIRSALSHILYHTREYQLRIYFVSNVSGLSAAALQAKSFVHHFIMGFFLPARSEQLFHLKSNSPLANIPPSLSEELMSQGQIHCKSLVPTCQLICHGMMNMTH